MGYGKIAVGDKVLEPCRDGISFGLNDSGATLYFHYVQPTAAERRAFRDSLSVRFAVADGLIFILAKIATSGWNDCPYYPYSVGGIPNGMGLSAHTMLVDASTGILIEQRLRGFKTEGSRKLVEAVRNQKKIDNYMDAFARTMRLYSTNRLVQNSILLL